MRLTKPTHDGSEGREGERRRFAPRMVVALAMLLSFSLRAESEYSKALELARERQRPLLVHFSATWCQPCRLMERTTLQHAVVTNALARFVTVKVDFDNEPDVVSQHGIRGIPAFVIVSPEGDTVSRNTGYVEAARFEEWLMEGLSQAAFAMSQKKVVAEHCREVEAALNSEDPDLRRKGIEAALALCGAKEGAYREFAAARLEAIAEKEPRLLFDGLNAPRLAVRIHVANLLREKLGADFRWDPWAGSEERAAALEEMKKSQ